MAFNPLEHLTIEEIGHYLSLPEQERVTAEKLIYLGTLTPEELHEFSKRVVKLAKKKNLDLTSIYKEKELWPLT
jgi:hypothetical protein